MVQITHGMGSGIACGALAATGTLLAAFFLAGAGETLEWEALAYVLPFLVIVLPSASFLIALTALVLGLPVMWLLDRMHCASRASLGLAGAAVGAALFVVPSLDDAGRLDTDLLAFVLAAVAGGGVTGWVWGALQERLQAAAQRPVPANRIDDQRMLR
ncbi:hypothetical protein [Alteraurantiacibacter buctensis]|uniref:Uncharacterized protein n=1 Tax=Alteraurantiacibacter buctensis TaxID=1503981 RepID=A0A844YYQ5_9SPHN|nr:hypothetical protein [Alteraurantiacibacter buctensis]MXO70863.1 hypothetical protein [Alteraurantiacibacter buctensis]